MLSQQVMVALAWLTPAVVFAQAGAPTIEVTDPVAMAALTRLNGRIEALSKQVMVCVDKKLAVPELCFCHYPAELAQVRREFQAVTLSYPRWSTRTVAWQDRASGSPVGYTLALAHLGPQLSKCPDR